MNKNKTGCLILHGFAGSRSEIRSLSKKLSEKGYQVSTPLLAGHEGSRKELAAVSYRDWIQSAETALAALEKRCEKIVVIGFSMGGLIGVNLCRKHRVSGLILVNTPVYYWYLKQIFKNLSDDFETYSKKYLQAGTDKPLSALIEFVTLLNKTKPLFADISCPTLIFQTLDDDTVNPKSANYIYSKVYGQKVIKNYQTGGHEVFQTETGYRIINDICSYLKRNIPLSFTAISE